MVSDLSFYTKDTVVVLLLLLLLLVRSVSKAGASRNSSLLSTKGLFPDPAFTLPFKVPEFYSLFSDEILYFNSFRKQIECLQVRCCAALAEDSMLLLQVVVSRDGGAVFTKATSGLLTIPSKHGRRY